MQPFDKQLIIEDGSRYFGYSFGKDGDVVSELVFNTSMVGYQEIISDPSYTYQTVVMSYPLIGNYGINEDDFETATPTISGLVVRDYNDLPSNFRSCKTLGQTMREYGIVGIYGVDTRRIVRSIRDLGSRRCLITSADTSVEEGLEIIRNTPVATDAVAKVSRTQEQRYAVGGDLHIVAIDCGIKQNIIRSFNARGIDVTVVPWNTTASRIQELKPDGVFISNGPGDPTDVKATISTVKSLIGKYPIFGICLGHQILALAYGGKTYKLKFGHRGGNHPVKNLVTEHIEITSQNHSYAVDRDSLQGPGLEVTHVNLLDGTVEGMRNLRDKVFSVQYHPESAPGPNDSGYLFDGFIAIVKENKNA
ncbi:MAG: glutamine-hydrolyzing carbamoyl-phosphate synthase small subunit [Christensenellales bacterium]